MNFKLWESSYSQLYNSAVAAYPETTRRQHATQTIKIAQLNWTPFVGMNTLFLRGLAQNFADGGGEYRPIIVFKGVEYQEASGDGIVDFVAGDDGREYHVTGLSRNQDILVRCNCKDFYWRFSYFDHLDRSLQGRVRAPYVATTNRGPVNPTESPGCCKHLMRMFEMLSDSGLIVD